MHSKRGFSLLETLLYLGIFAIVGGSLFSILTNVVRISTREVSSDEVSTQLQFAMETVSRLVRESSAIETETTATSTLKLRMQNAALDPTCISVVDGVLKLSQGPDAYQPQNCAAATTDITTNKIIVDTAFFKRVEFPGGHDQVAVDLQFSNTATGASKISRALRSGISRASAATFDSDLLPNADNSYEVGFSGTKRWKNVSLSNLLNLGVISSDPGGIDGSIYYNSTSKSFRGKANGTWGDLGSSLWLATSTNSMYSNVTGNVGIGTMNPQAKLDVNGDAKINGLTIGKGASALQYNTAFGVNALSSLTSGAQETAIGYGALQNTTTGGYNTAVGSAAGQYLTTGTENALFGGNAGIFITSGSYNTAIGVASGYTDNINPLTTGSRNVLLGHSTGVANGSDSNSIAIGSDVRGLGSNTAVIGDSLITKTILNGNIGIGQASPTQKLDVNGTAKATQINSGNYCDINGANCKTITAMGGSTITAVSFGGQTTTGDAICASIGKSCITSYNYNGAYNVACYYTHAGIGAYCY